MRATVRWLLGGPAAPALAAILAVAVGSVELADEVYHGDESAWIHEGDGAVRCFRPGRFDDPFWSGGRFSFGWMSGTVGKLVIGLGLRARGQTWDLPDEVPPREVLWAGRSAVLAVSGIGVAAFFALARRMVGTASTWGATMLFATAPLWIAQARRAMVDVPMMAATLSALWIVLGAREAASADRPIARVSMRYACAGILFGLAGSAKWNAAGPALAVGALLLVDVARAATGSPVELRARRATVRVVGGLLVAILASGVFVGTQPYLWPDPLGRFLQVIDAQSGLMESRIAWGGGFATGAYPPGWKGVTELTAGLVTAGPASRVLLAASALTALVAVRARHRGRPLAAVIALALAGAAALSGLWDPGANVSTWTLWAAALVGAVAAVALGPAALGVDTPRAREALALVLAAGAGATAMVVRTTYITWARYWLPLLPMLAVAAALGISFLIRPGGVADRARRILVGVSLASLGVAFALTFPQTTQGKMKFLDASTLGPTPAIFALSALSAAAWTTSLALRLFGLARRGIPAIGLAATLAILAAQPAAAESLTAAPGVRIDDPYAGASGPWWRGQVHAHSNTHRVPADADSLREKVEFYRDAGFDFVSITDHNQSPAIPGANPVALPTRDPGVEGILYLSGAEIGFRLASYRDRDEPARFHHIGGVGMNWSVERGDSLFRLTESDWVTAQAAVDSIRTLGYGPDRPALAILNHPEMEAIYVTRFYPVDLGGTASGPLRNVTGIEVYNTKWARSRPGGKAWQNHGASHWDLLLDRGGDARWGFATDDAHHYVVGYDYLGGWILVRAESLATVPILDAIRDGRFVACVDSCEGATRDTTSATLTEIGVEDGAIVAASDRPSEFSWWVDAGHEVRRVRGVERDRYRVEGWERSVRLRVRNDAGAVYSQPFRVDAPGRDPDRWRLAAEPGCRLLLHFDEGEGPMVRDASGQGLDLLLSPVRVPPIEAWRDLGDTTAYRDSLWGGWFPNGVGTTPDETDVDRDRSGYAVRSWGRSVQAEIPVRRGSPLRDPGAFTVEWIGCPLRRTGSEQPLLVDESEDGAGRRRGWRVAVAPAGAASAYRFRWYDAAGDAHTLAFGRGVPDGEVELLGVTFDPGTAGRPAAAIAYRGGRAEADLDDPGRAALRSSRDPGGAHADAATPFRVFADPFAPDAESYYRLRELRITAGTRPPARIAADAERLGLPPLASAP